MKISFEGLPGTRKNEILNILQEKHSLKIIRENNQEWFDYFNEDRQNNCLAYQLYKLIFYHDQLKQESNSLFSSLCSLRHVYLDYFFKHEYLNQKQYELLVEYYNTFYTEPDYIIYFYGTYENTQARLMAKNSPQLDTTSMDKEDQFKQLYYHYEWQFDNNNCHVPIFKVNIDDDMENIIRNIVHILEKIENQQIN